MDDRSAPRVGVLGYGSILSPDDIDDLAPGGTEAAIPVRVSGFARRFNQEASWRDTDGRERAVLNVEPEAEAWFNAVLLPDLDRESYATFRERERGYRLVEVEADELEPYDPEDGDRTDAIDIVLVAVGERTATDIDPIPEYVDICLEGAAHWGAEFEAEFLGTTETAAGVPLSEYLDDR
jgi:hypothetical protein